jgi:hypothetical protein
MKKMNYKNISFYDNGGKTFDRITVIFNDSKRATKDGYVYDCLACSHSGSGFFQHSDAMKGKHLGKKVSFDNLSPELQKRLKTYFND